MRVVLYIIIGSSVAFAAVVAVTILIGDISGQLYSNEDESTRNFEIFLLCAVTAVIAGGWVGAKVAARSARRRV
jgi:hypothetical protein